MKTHFFRWSWGEIVILSFELRQHLIWENLGTVSKNIKGDGIQEIAQFGRLKYYFQVTRENTQPMCKTWCVSE